MFQGKTSTHFFLPEKTLGFTRKHWAITGELPGKLFNPRIHDNFPGKLPRIHDNLPSKLLINI